MTFPFAGQVVFLLFVLGGIIAYIGNYVGKYIGKRRLTIFNLRPRYTATIITVVSGILIAVSTLLIVLLFSQDARMAFLGLEQLKSQVAEKSQELEKANQELETKLLQQKELEAKLNFARKEIGGLQGTKQKLSREVILTRKGQFLFLNGEVIALSLIKAGPEREKLELGLKGIISDAEISLRHSIRIEPADFERAIEDLLKENKIFVIKLVADSNVLGGEVIPVHFELIDNRLVYHGKDEILAAEIASGLSETQAEQEVLRGLKLSQQAARQAGVLPDASGSMGSIPYSQIFDLAKKIKGSGRKTLLKILAKKDIYSVGPLEIEFKTQNK